jgi:hypothetical protein
MVVNTQHTVIKGWSSFSVEHCPVNPTLRTHQVAQQALLVFIPGLHADEDGSFVFQRGWQPRIASGGGHGGWWASGSRRTILTFEAVPAVLV